MTGVQTCAFRSRGGGTGHSWRSSTSVRAEERAGSSRPANLRRQQGLDERRDLGRVGWRSGSAGRFAKATGIATKKEQFRASGRRQSLAGGRRLGATRTPFSSLPLPTDSPTSLSSPITLADLAQHSKKGPRPTPDRFSASKASGPPPSIRVDRPGRVRARQGPFQPQG